MQETTKAPGFLRGLTRPQEEAIKSLLRNEQSWLYKWFSDEDRKPFLGIRNGYASIYVKGCAFKFLTNSSRDAFLEFNEKYLTNSCGLKVRLQSFLRGRFYAVPSAILQQGTVLSEIVDAALHYIHPDNREGKRSHDKERPLVTQALLEYPLSLDCEICFTADMVETVKCMPEAGLYKSCPKKPDALLLHFVGEKIVLRFFEIKDVNSDEWGSGGVVNQVRLYDGVLKNFEECIVEQYKKVVKLYSELDHPRFSPFKSLVESIDKMCLDLNHDVVILGVPKNPSRDNMEVKVKELDAKMKSPESLRERRVHLSHNASEWLS